MDTWGGNAQSPLSLNKYLYGDANPVNRIDPTGHVSLMEEMVTVAVIGALSTVALPAFSSQRTIGRSRNWSVKLAFNLKVVPGGELPLKASASLVSADIFRYSDDWQPLQGNAFKILQLGLDIGFEWSFLEIPLSITWSGTYKFSTVRPIAMRDFNKVVVVAQDFSIQTPTGQLSLFSKIGFGSPVSAQVDISGWDWGLGASAGVSLSGSIGMMEWMLDQPMPPPPERFSN